MRIVLPPRRDGQPPASSSRETAMINLPPKPVQKPAGSVERSRSQPAPRCETAGASAAVGQPSLRSTSPRRFRRHPPAPKPPSIAGVAPLAPRPPPSHPDCSGSCHPAPAVGTFRLVPHSQIGLVRWRHRRWLRNPGHSDAVGVNRSVGFEGTVRFWGARRRASEGKKETAKVPPSTSGPRPLPQASVHLQRKPGASSAAPRSGSTVRHHCDTSSSSRAGGGVGGWRPCACCFAGRCAYPGLDVPLNQAKKAGL